MTTAKTTTNEPHVLTITVQDVPVPKARPRAVRRGPGVRMYTDHATQRWENIVALNARTQAARSSTTTPMVGPLAVFMAFWLPRPRSVKQEYPATARADVDNLAKAVLDGMQTGGVFANDRQVVDLVCFKRYADERPPGVDIEVFPVKDLSLVAFWIESKVAAMSHATRPKNGPILGPDNI